MKRLTAVLAALVVATLFASCNYARLLRPRALKQLNPRVVEMVNYLPDVDDPNERIIARLFAHGGLSHAELGEDGVFRDRVRVPRDEFIWYPAIVVMKRAGELELEFSNEDVSFHIAFLPNHGAREVLQLPSETAGRPHQTRPAGTLLVRMPGGQSCGPGDAGPHHRRRRGT